MEALPIANEVAVPIRASEVPTERIFMRDRLRAFQIGSTPPSDARAASTISKRTLIGLCLTTFAFGILLTSTINRSWRPLAPQSLERAAKLPPPPAPPVLQVVPIVATPLPSVLEAPAPSRDLASKPRRDVRVRATRAGQARRPASELPESAPLDPAPPKPWVDPFAD
jgi:hypothetical protein